MNIKEKIVFWTSEKFKKDTGQQWALFIVSADVFSELVDDGFPTDQALTEAGYRSIVINNTPIIYDADVQGQNVVTIRQDLIHILARKATYAALIALGT